MLHQLSNLVLGNKMVGERIKSWSLYTCAGASNMLGLIVVQFWEIVAFFYEFETYIDSYFPSIHNLHNYFPNCTVLPILIINIGQ